MFFSAKAAIAVAVIAFETNASPNKVSLLAALSYSALPFESLLILLNILS